MSKIRGKRTIFPLKKGMLCGRWELGLEQEQEDIKQSQILRRKKVRNLGGQDTIGQRGGKKCLLR
jgi:hypothetical protein